MSDGRGEGRSDGRDGEYVSWWMRQGVLTRNGEKGGWVIRCYQVRVGVRVGLRVGMRVGLRVGMRVEVRGGVRDRVRVAVRVTSSEIRIKGAGVRV